MIRLCRNSMSAAFEQAWLLLKAAFVPTDPDQQIGAGNFRTVYGQKGNPDATKFGYGPGLSNMATLDTLAQMYPELFIGEKPAYLEKPESGLPDYLMRKPTGHMVSTGTLGPDSMPLPSTQELGQPLVRPTGYTRQGWDKSKGIDLQNAIANTYPLTEAAQMWDVKPENWLGTETGRVPSSEVGVSASPRAKLMDPMFMGEQQTFRPMSQIQVEPRTLAEFGRKLPDVEDFAEPWSDMVYEQGTPSQVESFDTMTSEEAQMQQALRDRLGI